MSNRVRVSGSSAFVRATKKYVPQGKKPKPWRSAITKAIQRQLRNPQLIVPTEHVVGPGAITKLPVKRST